ncbi:MAG: Caspase domain protein, partial [Planctomycetaceae bacterium]|nr:Caspase domain protein [Planctomycetaceae bacterium]
MRMTLLSLIVLLVAAVSLVQSKLGNGVAGEIPPALKSPDHSAVLKTTCEGPSNTSSVAEKNAAPAEKVALLIGCSKYSKFPYLSSAGPANDVALWAKLLTERFEFSPQDITILSDPSDGANTRSNPKGAATRANIIAAFERLIDIARPGTQMFILVDGHGSRLPALEQPSNLDVLGPDGMIAVFLPEDVKAWTGATEDNFIRHDQFGEWSHRLRMKGAHVWFVFDCCHAGAMSHDLINPETRGVEPQHLGVPVRAIHEAAERHRKRPESKSDDSQFDVRHLVTLRSPVSPTVPTDGRLTAFFGAQYWEEGVSLYCPKGAEPLDKNRFGMLSYSLAECVNQQHFRGTYRQLSQRVAARFRDRLGARGPTPKFEGELDRELFSSISSARQGEFTICRTADGSLQLAGGELHGITAGTILAVRTGIADPKSKHDSLGYVRVETQGLELFTSIVSPCVYEGHAATTAAEFPETASGVMIRRELGDLRIRLACEASDSTNSEIAKLKQNLDQALKSLGPVVAQMVNPTPGSMADWSLRIVTPAEAKQTFGMTESEPMVYLLDTVVIAEQGVKEDELKSLVAPRLNFPRVFGRYSPTQSSKLAEVLRKDLPKVFHWQNLWRIASALNSSPDPSSPGLHLDLVRLKNATDQEGEPFHEATLRPDEILGCRVRNDNDVGLWVSIILVRADFSIQLVQSFTVEPNSTYPLQTFPIQSIAGDPSLLNTGPEGVILLAVPMTGKNQEPD